MQIATSRTRPPIDWVCSIHARWSRFTAEPMVLVNEIFPGRSVAVGVLPWCFVRLSGFACGNPIQSGPDTSMYP